MNKEQNQSYSTRIYRILSIAAPVILTAVYAAIHIYAYPSHYSHWYAGIDQTLYLKSAQAWAAGDLNPDLHYYLPGYAILGVPFVSIFPYQPFMIPDLLCLLVTLWLFVTICRQFLSDHEWAPVFAIAAFLIATLSSRYAVTVWSIPLTTTASAPLILAALLGALRFGRAPTLSTLFWTMLAGAAMATFRPTDAALTLTATGLYVGGVVLRLRPDHRQIAAMIVVAAAGVALPLIPLLAAHIAIHGLTPGDYLTFSAKVGFQWRLIPFRWAVLVIDPRPLFPEGMGLARVFPWIVPGIAGMALALMKAGRGKIGPHLLVIGTMTALWLLYLSYVDLHTYGLFRYYNYHYFKICFPFLAFYALLLADAFFTRGVRPQAFGVFAVVLVGLFFWRPELEPRSPEVRGQIAGQKITLPDGLSEMADVAVIPVSGDWHELYAGYSTLTAGGQTFNNLFDFKIFPAGESAMVMPLRVLPGGPAELSLIALSDSAPPFPIDVTKPALEERRRIVFGLPCLFAPLVRGCRSVPLAP